MVSITAEAPANIAFIKFWGRSNDKLFIPLNPSISMTMSNCIITTTAKLNPALKEDIIEVKFHNQQHFTKLKHNTDIKEENIFNQIKRIRKLAGSNVKVHIKSFNSFPSDSGIASSASGFSALTACLLVAYGLKEMFDDKKEFSKQVRLSGSGSAARSVYGGIVELLSGESHDEAYSIQLYDENYWDLVDLVCIIDPWKKKVSSSKGHLGSKTSNYMNARQAELPLRIKLLKQALKNKDLRKLGEVIEADALSMHAVMLTQDPALIYWEPGTISIMKQLISLREQLGILGYFTIDAGANVHVITDKYNATKLKPYLRKNRFIREIIYNEACEGVKLSDAHIF